MKVRYSSNARYLYAHYPTISVINVKHESGGISFTSELTVSEATEALNEFSEAIRDVTDSDYTYKQCCECPSCGFSYSIEHIKDGEIDCPLCELEELKKEMVSNG